MKRGLFYSDLFLGIVCIIYYLTLVFAVSSIAFKEFFLVVGAVLLLHHFLKSKINRDAYKKIIRVVRPCLILGICGFLFIQGLIVFYSKDNIEEADYMIVLGAGLNKDEISLTLKQRLDKAIEYSKERQNVTIIVSGGQGHNETISEASAMSRYLIENGIDKEKIILEDKSTSTFENFKYSYEKIYSLEGDAIKNKKIKVVTSDFHAFRSSIIGRRVGFNDITFYTNKSYKPLIPVMYTREAFAVVKTIIFDK